MKKYLTVIVLLTSLNTWADRVGNGGDVIVCPGARTEVLDIYQGRTDWGFNPILMGTSREEIISNLLKPLIAVDAKIGTAIAKRANELNRELYTIEEHEDYKSKLVRLTKNELVNIPDEGVAELPEGCKIVQAATQVQNSFPNEVKFTFQKGIWDSMDTDAQTSLILHEVIYEHMIKNGEYSSRSTRYFNAALHAGSLSSVKDYFNVSSLFGFRNLEIVVDAPERSFGASKNCSIQQKWSQVSEMNGLVTIVRVNRRNVLQGEISLDQALNTLWKKYVEKGLCE